MSFIHTQKSRLNQTEEYETLKYPSKGMIIFDDRYHNNTFFYFLLTVNQENLENHVLCSCVPTKPLTVLLPFQ